MDNVRLFAGSFSKPGRYTGTVKISGSLPSADISSFHTESVVADAGTNGSLFVLTQPSGTFLEGAFISGSTVALSGTTQSFTLKGTNLDFTTIDSAQASDALDGTTAPETTTSVFKLHRVGD